MMNLLTFAFSIKACFNKIGFLTIFAKIAKKPKLLLALFFSFW